MCYPAIDTIDNFDTPGNIRLRTIVGAAGEAVVTATRRSPRRYTRLHFADEAAIYIFGYIYERYRRAHQSRGALPL